MKRVRAACRSTSRHGVERVLVEHGAAVGVLTDRGEEIRARSVVCERAPAAAVSSA